jgi:hypothetical protein
MARDFDNIYNPDELSDEELRGIVREELAARDAVDADSIIVTAEQGKVRLSGRVGTESERRIADRILSDVIGLRAYQNDLVVDTIRRDEEPEAIDDHLAEGTSSSGGPIGTAPEDEFGPEAEHLREDLNARLYGTPDHHQSTARGTAWIPPESPTSEGVDGMEPDSDVPDEDH